VLWRLTPADAWALRVAVPGVVWDVGALRPEGVSRAREFAGAVMREARMPPHRVALVDAVSHDASTPEHSQAF
jgi:hypothetical protein